MRPKQAKVANMRSSIIGKRWPCDSLPWWPPLRHVNTIIGVVNHICGPTLSRYVWPEDMLHLRKGDTLSHFNIKISSNFTISNPTIFNFIHNESTTHTQKHKTHPRLQIVTTATSRTQFMQKFYICLHNKCQSPSKSASLPQRQIIKLWTAPDVSQIWTTQRKISKPPLTLLHLALSSNIRIGISHTVEWRHWHAQWILVPKFFVIM